MRWSPEQVAAIVARRGKHSASKIAADYGCTRDAIIGVWNRARAADPAILKLARDNSALKIHVRHARSRGKLFREIAAEFGITKAYAWQIAVGYRRPTRAQRVIG